MGASSIATTAIASFSLAFASSAATPQVAHADVLAPSLTPAAPRPRAATTRVFYGWRNFGVDAASIGVVVLGAARGDNSGKEIALVGLGGYLVGSPIVHALHGHGDRAMGSFALRLGVPLALGALTWEVQGKGKGFEVVTRPITVGFVGALSVLLFDDLVLAYDEKPVGATLAPSVGATSRGGMTFGVAGTF